LNDKDIILRYLWSLVGKPYIWGGTGAVGFDCSGLVVEMLKARGFCKSKYDATAHTLYDATRNGGVLRPSAHCLAFFGRVNGISHVGYCLNEEYMIEASGGNSRCTSVEAAEKYGAYVRVRPIFHRKDFKAIHMPDIKHFK